MRSKSCHSTNLDAYRAGLEVAEALRPLEPEVILLFASIHYEQPAEILEAIRDVLGERVIVVGTSGDGFYELRRVSDVGVAALGLRGDGAVQWFVSHETGVGAEPRAATERCMKRLAEAVPDGGPSLIYLLSDLRTDTTEMLAALHEHATAPVVGGLACDDHALEKSHVFVDGEVRSDCVVALAMVGTFDFEIRVAHQAQLRGEPGVVTSVDGKMVLEIDGAPATTFLENAVGKPLNVADEGTITFCLTDPERGEEMVRSLLLPKGDGQGVRLMGNVSPGHRAQVCLATEGDLVESVRAVGDDLAGLPFEPTTALIVSCAGRKKVLAGSVDHEVQDILSRCPSLEALAGFPSSGEFGPVATEGGYTRALFHNMTYILVLFGAARA